MSIKEVLTILSIFFMIAPSHAKIMTGKVIDKETNEPIEGVAVFLLKDSTKATFTDKKGVFFIDLPDQTDQIKINAFGYKILQTTISDNSVFKLEIDTYTFDDIVVTATENAGLTSSSKINNHTMKLLQPSCLSDIMELFPEGKQYSDDQYFNFVDFDKDYLRLVDSLTCEDIRKFAQLILNQKNRLRITMMPE